MHTHWIGERVAYDGSQLHSLFAYMNHGLLGDSLVAWRGSCDVSPRHMVDGEDLRANSAIRSDEMIHFILEKFDCSLLAAVALQRLLATVARECLVELAEPNTHAIELRRQGDYLYLGERKLSVSIATVSPVSALIHFAVNITNSGTPVPTLALEDLKVNPEIFASQVMRMFSQEVASIVDATRKVFGVK